VNHTRLPKEVLLPDSASQDIQGKKGDCVELPADLFVECFTQTRKIWPRQNTIQDYRMYGLLGRAGRCNIIWLVNVNMLEEPAVSIFRVLFYPKMEAASFSTMLVPTHQPVSVKFQTNVIFMHITVLTSNLTLHEYLIHKGNQPLFTLTQDHPTLSH
jgi:hypothetical protein